jgi:hypothetical protein
MGIADALSDAVSQLRGYLASDHYRNCFTPNRRRRLCSLIASMDGFREELDSEIGQCSQEEAIARSNAKLKCSLTVRQLQRLGFKVGEPSFDYYEQCWCLSIIHNNWRIDHRIGINTKNETRVFGVDDGDTAKALDAIQLFSSVHNLPEVDAC